MIKDLTGTSGRLDIIFRCLLAAFSFGYQKIRFHTVLNGPPDPPKSLEFNGNRMNELPVDEIGIALMFQTLLDPQNPPKMEGITLENKSFLEIAKELAQEGPVFLLRESAPPFKSCLSELKKKKTQIKSAIFILSDHLDLEKQDETFLIEKLGVLPISLGFKSYLASQCIIFVLMELKKSDFLDDIKG